LALELGGRQTLDCIGQLRLLLMVGRGIQAAMRQNSEPNRLADVGVQILRGPQEAVVCGSRAARED
jgi:hypothetical protein